MIVAEIDAADGVLLDFDGPVCSVFAGRPAPAIAREISSLLGERGIVGADRVDDDPLAILRRCARSAPDLLGGAEDLLVAAEMEAVTTARPNSGAMRFLARRLQLGQPVAIVSNNSAAAIRYYLELHGLDELVRDVLGRPSGFPELMKPHPHLLIEAAAALGCEPQRLVMIGDSVTDVEAASAARVVPVGMALRPGRASALRRAGAVVILDSEFDAAIAAGPATTVTSSPSDR